MCAMGSINSHSLPILRDGHQPCSRGLYTRQNDFLPHRIHVWYIYLHLVDFDGKNVGKYTTIHGWYGVLKLRYRELIDPGTGDC